MPMPCGTGSLTSGMPAPMNGSIHTSQPSTGGHCEGPHNLSCASSSLDVLHTCFYFTVFFNNNPPIFHSNRIPVDLLGIESSSHPESTVEGKGNSDSTAGPTLSASCAASAQHRWRSIFTAPVLDPRRLAHSQGGMRRGDGEASTPAFFSVGDFRTEAAAVDEVPQQTLQTVAFPTAFCSRGGGGSCPLPVRVLGARAPRRASQTLGSSPHHSRSAAQASPLTLQQQQNPSDQEEGVLEVSGSKNGFSCESSTKANVYDASVNSSGHRSSVDTTASPINDAHYTTKNNRSGSGNQDNNSHRAPPPAAMCVSSSRLPLTSTVSPKTAATATTTSNTTGTRVTASVVPARFQSTFPEVKWVEKKEKNITAVAADNSTTAADEQQNQRLQKVVHREEEKDPRRRETVTAVLVAADTAATPSATAAVPGRAAVRSRRPRPQVSASTPSHTAAQLLSQPSASSEHRQGSSSPTRRAQEGEPPPPPPALTKAETASASVTSPTRFTPSRPSHIISQKASLHSTTPTPLADTSTNVLPSPVSTEGPPWNMRIEEVCSAKGELRYYRLILAVSFAALITTHTGMLHSMQTRNAAVVFVLVCPPSGVHYRFFLHHVDVLRSVLNRSTEFAIRTVQRFFKLLFSPTEKPKGTQQQIFKGITKRLEMHAEARDAYRSVKAELANALRLFFPLPLLAPATAEWVMPVLMESSYAPTSSARAAVKGSRTTAAAATGGAAEMGNGCGRYSGVGRRPCTSASSTYTGWLTVNRARTPVQSTASPPLSSLSDILYEAIAALCDYSEGFTSAFVCGLLSLAEESGAKRESRTSTGLHMTAERNDSDGTSPPRARGSPSTTTTTTVTATAAHVREVSVSCTSLVGGNATTATNAITTPDWLSAYASYFHSLTTPKKAEEEEREGGDRWVRLSRPVNDTALFIPQQPTEMETDGVGNNDDICLQPHFSGTTVSSITPVLSPLTVDLEVRSPSARLTRSRNLSTLSPTTAARCTTHSSHSNASHCVIGSTGDMPEASAAALPTLSVVTAKVLTAAPRNTNGRGSHNSSAGEVVNASGVSQPQTSTATATPPLPATTGSPTVAVVTVEETSPSPAAHPSRQQQPPSTGFAAAAACVPSSPNAAPAGEKEDEYILHRGRLGRVVIFTQNAALARRLLLVAAFLWCDCSNNNSSSGGRRRGSRSVFKYLPKSFADGADSTIGFHHEDAQRMYETAVAAAVRSAEFASTPIQWVPEEFSEAQLATLCSRFSPENTLLVVVPRQLLCRRISLRKHVAGTTVLVEQQAGKEARIRSSAFPFRCSITKQTVLLPDPTVTTLLREARSLHHGSYGTVDFVEVFQRMVWWLYWQSAAAVLKKRDVQVQTAAAAASIQTALLSSEQGGGGGSEGGGGGGLSRYASMDVRWPSCSVSAMGSHVTSPASVIPVALLNDFPRTHAAAASFTPSASPGSQAIQLDRPWNVESSAEESLLPGSCGGASAAWAYVAAPTTTGVPQYPTSSGGHRSFSAAVAVNAEGGGGGGDGALASTSSTSTLLVSHGLLQPPSAFVTASPTAATAPQRSSSLRFLNWLRASPTATAGPHFHPILSPATLGQLSACDGGQLPGLLCEDDHDLTQS